jgi:hypothetical protein
VNTGDVEYLKSALQGLIIQPSIKEMNSRMELALYGKCSAVGTIVVCSKVLCLTGWYDITAAFLSAVRPYDVSNGLL